MSNLSAYNDYHGPRIPGVKTNTFKSKQPSDVDDNDQDEDDTPMMWMEGDSLAPPCGSSVPFIHTMLNFGSVNRDDILYDLGSGDGRILLEGLVVTGCRQCVGIEVEEDLVQRNVDLIDALPVHYKETSSTEGINKVSPRIQAVHADLRLVLKDFAARIDNTGDKDDADGNKRPFQHLPMPTAMTIFLLPEAMAEIEETVLVLLPHMRIICSTWGLKDIKPIAEHDYHDKSGASTSMFLYTKECFERLEGFEYMLSVYHGH